MVPQRRDQVYYPKDEFKINLQTMTCTRQGEHCCKKVISIGSGKPYGAPDLPLSAFRFDAALCDASPLQPSCVRARPGHGRLVMLHHDEALLQKVRASQ
jgi:hypothetical protein